MSNHEVCFTFKKKVALGLIAVNLMSVEGWMGVPVEVTVRQGRSIYERLEKGLKREKMKLGDECNAGEYYDKQRDLEKLVESQNDKIQKLKTQPE